MGDRRGMGEGNGAGCGPRDGSRETGVGSMTTTFYRRGRRGPQRMDGGRYGRRVKHEGAKARSDDEGIHPDGLRDKRLTRIFTD